MQTVTGNLVLDVASGLMIGIMYAIIVNGGPPNWPRIGI